MPRSETDTSECRDVLGRLEPLIDGDLERAERRAVEGHLESCPSCRRELALARALRDELRALPSLDAAPTTLQRVLEVAEREVSARRSFLFRPRLAWAALAVIAIALGLAAVFVDRRPRPEPRTAEVAVAVEQARFALAKVGELTRKAGLDLRDEVLPSHLAAPLRETVERSLLPQRADPADGSEAATRRRI